MNHFDQLFPELHLGKRILEECFRHLCQSKSSGDGSGDSFVAFNSLGWDRSEIIEIPAQTGDSLQQYSAGKNTGYVRGMEKDCYGHPSLARSLLNANIVPTTSPMCRNS